MKKSSVNTLYHTRSIRKQDFLEENGIKPSYYLGNCAYYVKSRKLCSLLESYEINMIFYESQLRK